MPNPAPYQNFTALGIARDGHVLTITIENPPLNPMTESLHEELSRVFRLVQHDIETRVVVLTGAGEKAFSAGGNLDLIAENIDNHQRWMRMNGEAREIIISMIECDTPIVARVNGHAIGIGCSLALAADMAIMAEDAKIGDSHVAIGLVAGDGGSLLWPLLVGLNRAKQYLLTGEPLKGREAAVIGLINIAVPSAELDATVALWAGRMAKLPPPAVKGTKRALNALVRQHAQALSDLHLGYETLSHLSTDHHEAIDAMRAKRPPSFTGR